MPPKPPNPGRKKGQSREASYLSIPPLPPPETTRPVVFCIPDHPDWRASLYSSVSLMGSWLAWKRDDAHSGKDVAAIWNTIITEAQLAAERGEPSECMDWCMIIAECIANDADTKQALRNLIATDSEIADSITDIIQKAYDQGKLTLEQRNGPFVKPGTCDDDHLFRQVIEVVDLLEDAVTDLIQLAEQWSNPLERASNLIEAIPGFGELPFDDIIEFGDQIIDNLKEEYEGTVTTDLLTQVKCDLFCFYKGECEVSVETLQLWYVNQTNGAIPFKDPISFFLQVAKFLREGDIEGDIIYYAFSSLALGAIRAGNSFMGETFNSFVKYLRAVADEMDNNWRDLCEECSDPELPPVFAVTDGFPPRGYGWWGGVTSGSRDPVFISTDGTFDIWDIPFERTQDDNYQSLVDIVPNGKIYNVSSDLDMSLINFYLPSPVWTNANSVSLLGAVRFITGEGHNGYIRVRIGPTT